MTSETKRSSKQTDIVVEFDRHLDYSKPGLYIFKISGFPTYEQFSNVKQTLIKALNFDSEDKRKVIVLTPEIELQEFIPDNWLTTLVRKIYKF